MLPNESLIESRTRFKMAKNTPLMLCLNFLCLFVLTASSAGLLRIDHNCGSTIDTDSRIECSLPESGVYSSNNVYNNVEQMTFGRLYQKVVDLQNLPNVEKVIVLSFLNKPCNHLILSDGRSVGISYKSQDGLHTTLATCTGSAQVEL